MIAAAATGQTRVPVEKRLSWQARGGWVRHRMGWVDENTAILTTLQGPRLSQDRNHASIDGPTIFLVSF